MAEQELYIVRLKHDFYRDGFYKVLLALLIIVCAIVLLIAVSLFLFFSKPTAVEFSTDDEWRVLAPVPVEKPYLSTPDLLQWVSESLPNLFNVDFVNYKKEIEEKTHYFTPAGQAKYNDVVNEFLNADNVQNLKLFTNAVPGSAPIVLNQGLLEGKYAWWVQMTLDLNYMSADKSNTQTIQVQALVNRVSTLNNLDGVIIDNIIVTRK